MRRWPATSILPNAGPRVSRSSSAASAGICRVGACRRQGVHAVQLGFRIAGTVVRRRVHQAVAGHDAVQAAAADPVIDVPVLLLEIDELDAGSRRDDEVVGGLGDVAAVVEPIGVDVRRKLDFGLARFRVAAGEDAGVLRAGRRGVPDQPAGHQQIFGRLIAGLGMRRVPQLLAVLLGIGPHHAVAAGEQHDVVVQQQPGAEIDREPRPPLGLGRFPALLAGLSIEANDLLAVVEEDAVGVGGQRQRRDLGVQLPQPLAALNVERHDLPRLFVPGILLGDAWPGRPPRRIWGRNRPARICPC